MVLFMAQTIGFADRLKIAWRILTNAEFATDVIEGVEELEASRKRPEPPPERVHASGLMLLSAFQREGRLVDFLHQEVAGFSDEDIGAAARVVHTGCRKVLKQFLHLSPAVPGAEGGPMIVPSGFDPQRVRLTGNVSGQPPFRGTLTHHGWVASEVRMPETSDVIDPRVIAPAEVDLA
jgi:hypothetical protein